MCGICGIISTEKNHLKIRGLVEKMTDALSHRGPDDSGVFSKENFSLGHRRLSIIDLSKNAKQPMQDYRGYLITYNGELYNYKDIRAELESYGEIFFSDSDTEVVLKSYIRWGPDCLQKFNGMYAFGIHFLTDNSIFLARDRVGIKPLYYKTDQKSIYFASELKPLLLTNNQENKLNLPSMEFYLNYGYFPKEFTPVKNIQQLQPGHYLIWKNNKISINCYWDPSNYLPKKETSIEENIDLLSKLIIDSVKKQSISDVEIGSFLSGGIDSGIVTSVLSNLNNKKLKTFSLGFADYKHNELDLAKKNIDNINAVNFPYIATPKEMSDTFNILISSLDQPLADTSMVPTFILSKFTKKHVKVVMSGDGGDELWGGYGNYKRFLQLEYIKKLLPRNFDTKNKFLLTTFVKSFLSQNYKKKFDLYNQILTYESKSWPKKLDSHLADLDITNILSDEIKKSNESDNAIMNLKLNNEENSLNSYMLNDFKLFMVDDVLRKVDMMSMMNGLEVRVPLLDHRIVEKSLSINFNQKVSILKTKIIGRKIAKNFLSKEIINSKKRGFAPPLSQIMSDKIMEEMNDTFSSRSFREKNMYKKNFITNYLLDRNKNKYKNQKLLLTIYILEKWMKNNAVSV
jgi:asparagine synthase (glutamine-hydrolysing)